MGDCSLFAAGVDLDAMKVNETLGDEEEFEDAEASPSALTPTSILLPGSVLIGLWVLTTSIPAIITVITELVWPRASGDLFGSASSTFTRQSVMNLIFAVAKLLVGTLLIAGRRKIAELITKLRYSPDQLPVE